MNRSKQFFIGIDVSKMFFDVAVLPVLKQVKEAVTTAQFENMAKGLKSFKKWLKMQGVLFNQNTLVVIENTGIYHRPLWAFCSAENLPIHIGNAAHIKWSFGIARGKSDKVDSLRLCHYAYKHFDELKPTPVVEKNLLALKDLITERTKLLTQITGLKTFLQELNCVNDKSTQKELASAYENALKGMQDSLVKLETLIAKKVSENESIKANYNLAKSVPGIGHLTAIYLICCTQNFTLVQTGKQLACYAGVVPFEHSSGTSIKGRTRVHPMANKNLKKMLHLCALSAKQHVPEFSIYYDRKKQEGKHTMSILNAIRNKLVLRVMAVIKNGKPYISTIQAAA